MLILKSVYDQIVAALFDKTTEKGGILGCQNGVVTHFYFDILGKGDDFCYYPNTYALNGVIKKWQESGVAFAGVIHSHTKGKAALSPEDILYAEKIFYGNALHSLYFPLVNHCNGQWQLTVFVYDGQWKREELKIV